MATWNVTVTIAELSGMKSDEVCSLVERAVWTAIKEYNSVNQLWLKDPIILVNAGILKVL